MSFGYGVVNSKSSEQKLRTKSSTEAEVFSVSDYLPYNIWIFLLMGAQGYDIKQNIFFEDNQISVRGFISQSILLDPLYFWGSGKESLSYFLPLFSSLREQCSLLFFLLFIF